jgi:two-component system, sensor histidine kinase and response regulator
MSKDELNNGKIKNDSLEHILHIVTDFTKLKNIRLKEVMRKEIIFYLEHLTNNYNKSSEENDELNKNIYELQKENESLKTLMADLGHDLKNSLSTLNGITALTSKEYNNILSEHPEICSTEFHAFFDVERDMIRTANSVFESYLAWIKNIVEHQPSVSKCYLVNDILTATYNFVKPLTQKKNISLKLSDLALTEKLEIFSDETKIQVIFNNLINNSIKFTPPGNNIKISAMPYGQDQVKLSVEDEGAGIPKDKWDVIFGEEQFTTKGTLGEMGTGRGTKICYRLVTELGGKIWVDNYEPSKVGTKISFTVPRYAKDNQ